VTNQRYYFDPRVASQYDARHGGSEAIIRDDVPFYVGLARQAAEVGQAVLELGCGTGRVTIPMAQTGAQVVGLDSSPAMLAVAREKASGLDNLRFVEGDMRSFDLQERFGLITIPFRSFMLLLTDEDRESCLRCVREHLLAGGCLAFNIANPEPLLRAGAIDAATMLSRPERGLQLRYALRDEVQRMLESAGFTVTGCYGWFDRRRFEAKSEEMIWQVIRQTGSTAIE
jgi:SAM-dependent methyltransferase